MYLSVTSQNLQSLTHNISVSYTKFLVTYFPIASQKTGTRQET